VGRWLYRLFDSRGLRISAPFAPGRKKEAIERLLRWIGASGRAARRLWSGRSEKQRAACLGPLLRLPPHQTEGQSPASTHTPSRENAFFLLFLAGKNSLRIALRRDKKLSDERSSRSVVAYCTAVTLPARVACTSWRRPISTHP